LSRQRRIYLKLYSAGRIKVKSIEKVYLRFQVVSSYNRAANAVYTVGYARCSTFLSEYLAEAMTGRRNGQGTMQPVKAAVITSQYAEVAQSVLLSQEPAQ